MELFKKNKKNKKIDALLNGNLCKEKKIISLTIVTINKFCVLVGRLGVFYLG